ncbi:GLPGLI family protein [Rhodoflexus caldus]|uniref:GLPGLI family protein n=1 Tax=Rhodoflexus caldus TaxID=2891236 RepID=UPI00202A2926|nr:GLPGLI family protein [Rhodoflexus caldus]
MIYKSILSAFLLVVTSGLSCYAQKLTAQCVQVEYREVLKDAILSQMRPETASMLKNKRAILRATTNESYYEELGSKTQIKEVSDPPQKAPLLFEDQQGASLNMTMIHNVTMMDWYKNFDSQKSIQIYRVGDKKARLENPLYTHEWEITNERAVIAGMNCKKAVRNHPEKPVVEAWFTDEIPITGGPSAFHGLPGLILKVETEQVICEAERIQFIEPFNMETLVKGELLDPNTFKQRISELFSESFKEQMMKKNK